MNPENQIQSLRIGLGSITADGSLPAMLAQKRMVIKNVSVCDVTGIAADNSNYIVLTLQSGATVLASYDSRAAGQGALAALVFKAAALVAAQAQREAGDSMKLVYDETGTVGMTDACVQIDYYIP